MDTVRIANKDFTPDEIVTLAKAGYDFGQKNDPNASGTPAASPWHGPIHGSSSQFGIFSSPGRRPGSYSAAPRMATVLAEIPLLPSDIQNERIEIMTGVTDGSGNNADFCAEPPKGGQAKVMAQVYRFGDIHIETNLAALPQIGMRRTRADISGELYNAATVDNPWLPQVPGMDGITDTMDLLATEFFTLGFQIERSVAKVAYAGSAGTQNSTYRGVYTQFAGLENLVKTGYTDVDTGLAAQAADSIVQNFNVDIGASDSNGLDFVEALTGMFYALNQKAAAVGMGGTTWGIAMRPEQFRRATEVWACIYATYMCGGESNGPVNRDAMAIQNLRLEMFNGRYLLIDGMRVPVILDEGITITPEAANQFRSDVYILPLSWAGRPLLFGEYFDMGNPYQEKYANFAGGETRVINNGLYRVGTRSTGLCKQYEFAAKVRLILDAPFLAGRLQNVRFTFLPQTRAADPGFTHRYANGGTTYRT